MLWSVALAVILFFILFPFGQMLSTAFKGPREQFALPVSFLPHQLTLINFQQALQYAPFFRYFLNSLSVSVVTTAIAVIIAFLGAYGFSRLQFPGRKFFLTLIVYSQMFCLAAIIIPIYRILAGLSLIDSYPGLIISFLTFTVPIAIWLLRSFLHNIPLQLEEAAYIEGASKFQAFWRVVVPLLQPAIGATGGLRLLPHLAGFPLSAGDHDGQGAPHAPDRDHGLRRPVRDQLGEPHGLLDPHRSAGARHLHLHPAPAYRRARRGRREGVGGFDP